MTTAYDETYIDDAMKNLGECFDYVANACQLDLDEFFQLFISSGIAEQFGKGHPKYVVGYSGTELAMEVMDHCGIRMDFPDAQVEYEKSSEYWSGWILAYYQWKMDRRFKDIEKFITMKDIQKMYATLHEASEEKFVDTVNEIIKRTEGPSKLQTQRKKCGYSQREVAEKAGVNLRTLQQYEIKAKDIGKASVRTVLRLAKVLGCEIEDIVE